MLAVTADIEVTVNSLLAVLVSDEVCHGRDRFECLTVTSDRCTAVRTGNRDKGSIVFSVGIHVAVNSDA